MSLARGPARRPAPGDVIPEGAARCTGCDKTKPLDQFHRDQHGTLGRRSRCKTCDRIYKRAWDRSPGGRATLAAYLARPEVQERRREARLKYIRLHREAIDRRENSTRGRLIRRRSQDAYAYLRAADPELRARYLSQLLARIAAVEAEMARQDDAAGVPPGERAWRPFVAPEWAARGLPEGVVDRGGCYEATGPGRTYLGRFPTAAVAAVAVAAAARKGEG